MTFKDYFSRQAKAYTRYRPGYPEELFRYLSSRAPAAKLAWDCATGNGQVAIALTRYFGSVYASDASAAQIAEAAPHPRVTYQVEPAERCRLESGSADLITVGQALHWLDRPRFYAEARRVLKASGVLAAWCYTLCRVSDRVDPIIDRLYREIVGEFWPEGRRLIETRYADIDFPFEPLSPPSFTMIERWTLSDFLGYLSTWSAVQRYKDQQHADPLALIAGDLKEAWGGEEAKREVRWELGLRAGRVNHGAHGD